MTTYDDVLAYYLSPEYAAARRYAYGPEQRLGPESVLGFPGLAAPPPATTPAQPPPSATGGAYGPAPSYAEGGGGRGAGSPGGEPFGMDGPTVQRMSLKDLVGTYKDLGMIDPFVFPTGLMSLFGRAGKKDIEAEIGRRSKDEGFVRGQMDVFGMPQYSVPDIISREASAATFSGRGRSANASQGPAGYGASSLPTRAEIEAVAAAFGVPSGLESGGGWGYADGSVASTGPAAGIGTPSDPVGMGWW